MGPFLKHRKNIVALKKLGKKLESVQRCKANVYLCS